MFYLPIYWESHHPKWLVFFRGVQTTNQMGLSWLSCKFSLKQIHWIISLMDECFRQDVGSIVCVQVRKKCGITGCIKVQFWVQHARHFSGTINFGLIEDQSPVSEEAHNKPTTNHINDITLLIKYWIPSETPFWLASYPLWWLWTGSVTTAIIALDFVLSWWPVLLVAQRCKVQADFGPAFTCGEYWYQVVSWNRGTPQIIHVSWIFH